MKTLFDTATQEEILQRFERVTPDRRPLWGRMNASQMLAHLGDQLRMGLGDIATSRASGLLSSRPVSWLMLYVIPWPHGAKGPAEAFTTAPAGWEEDKEKFRALIRRFIERSPADAWPEHPLFGKLSGKDWGVLSYKHFHHHLRQFGV
jgi:hypothetical protein